MTLSNYKPKHPLQLIHAIGGPPHLHLNKVKDLAAGHGTIARDARFYLSVLSHHHDRNEETESYEDAENNSVNHIRRSLELMQMKDKSPECEADIQHHLDKSMDLKANQVLDRQKASLLQRRAEEPDDDDVDLDGVDNIAAGNPQTNEEFQDERTWTSDLDAEPNYLLESNEPQFNPLTNLYEAKFHVNYLPRNHQIALRAGFEHRTLGGSGRMHLYTHTKNVHSPFYGHSLAMSWRGWAHRLPNGRVFRGSTHKTLERSLIQHRNFESAPLVAGNDPYSHDAYQVIGSDGNVTS